MKINFSLPTLCLALCAFVFSLAPSALSQGIQSFETKTVVSGGTNNVGAGATDTSVIVGGGISAGRHDTIGLLITQKPVGTNTPANVVYTFAKGISSTEVETTGSVTVTIATSASGATQSAFAKVDMGGASYLKLISIANASAVVVTNISVKGLLKAPGSYGFTR